MADRDSQLQQWRADRRRRLDVLVRAGFDGIHVVGTFGPEFTVCVKCGALVSLDAKEAPDGTWFAWAVQAHVDWHEEAS